LRGDAVLGVGAECMATSEAAALVGGRRGFRPCGNQNGPNPLCRNALRNGREAPMPSTQNAPTA
jgi:hypothetical protein